MHLLRSALELVAEEGMSSNLIDALIHAAGVSRGTFYNYFRSAEELLESLSTSVSRTLISHVDPVVQLQESAAARVSCGIRLCLQAGAVDRQLAAFISRGGPSALQQNTLLAQALCRDLEQGIRTGQFSSSGTALAYDLVVGPVLAAYHRLATGVVEPDYVDEIAAAVLVALGVNRASAKRLSRSALPSVWPATGDLQESFFKSTRVSL